MTDLRVAARATTPTEKSDSIVVSFSAEWYAHLIEQDLGAVIRKRIPKSNAFRWLYFHINSPISAICGRAPITELSNIHAHEAPAIADQLKLSAAEIDAYVGTASHIGCYRIGRIELCTKPISLEALTQRLSYFPPQSFFILSTKAKNVIDSLAGFRSSGANPPKGRLT